MKNKEKLNKLDKLEHSGRCGNPIIHRKEIIDMLRKQGYLKALDDVEKMIKKFPFSIYGTDEEFIINQMELSAKDREDILRELKKLRSEKC